MNEREIRLKIIEMYLDTFKNGTIPDHKRMMEDLKALLVFVYGT